jgi:subtilase family serine protease
VKRLLNLQLAVLAAVLVFAYAVSGLAQDAEPGTLVEQSEAGQVAPPHVPSTPGTLIIPKSSLPQTAPAGHKAAHTNFQILVPAGLKPGVSPDVFNGTGYAYETPASIACHYGLVTTTQSPSCDPNKTTVLPTGGSKTIAIVDAYDDPSAAGDLAWFSTQFGLTAPGSNFKVVWANTAASSCPVNQGFGVSVDITGNWEFEEALDIEWTHAMAPSAKIYLVEACSDLDTDLQQAILVANNLVVCGETELNATTGALGKCPTTSTGKGEVTMTWGFEEFDGQNTSDTCANLDDSCLTAAGVVYIAAAGDSPGVQWPSTSPNAVSAGGTTLRRNPTTFAFDQETAWVNTGGGQSAIESRQSYQSSISSIVGTWRGNPDLSLDSDTNTGLWVHDTFPFDGVVTYDWLIAGGTSAATVTLAGILNRAGAFAASSSAELTTIYTNKAVTTDFTDITVGYCGPYMGFSVKTGWDYCTGVGVVKGYTGK